MSKRYKVRWRAPGFGGDQWFGANEFSDYDEVYRNAEDASQYEGIGPVQVIDRQENDLVCLEIDGSSPLRPGQFPSRMTKIRST